MAENYKHLYEQMKTMVEMYQDELVPEMRKKIGELEQSRVEVVRCEECVHSITDGWICGGPDVCMPSHPTFPNCFCSYGERRNDG